MRTRRSFVALTAALALGAGGLVAAAPSSAAALTCDPVRRLTGGGGHRGASVTCRGGAFTGWTDCKKDSLIYRHHGNRAFSGGTSTMWCDVHATVVAAGVMTG